MRSKWPQSLAFCAPKHIHYINQLMLKGQHEHKAKGDVTFVSSTRHVRGSALLGTIQFPRQEVPFTGKLIPYAL